MAHEHNDECRRLHGIVDSLVAQQEVPVGSMLSNGVDVTSLSPDITAHPESDSSDDGNPQLELAAARQALEAIGCTG